MAYPFSDTNTNQIDLSSMLSYGNNGANTPNNFALGQGLGGAANIGVDVNNQVQQANVASQGADGWFGNLFNSKSLFGGTDEKGIQSQGWAMPAISLISGVLGMQQQKENSKLAKSQLNESIRQFDLNFGAQRKSINTDLEDRQRARVASAGGSGAYESVDSYLAKNRI